MSISRVRFITFDVTGTLLKFRKPPIEFYRECGVRHGVTIEDTEKLKTVFKKTWNRLNEESPNFGIRWETWWTRFVVQTFRGSSAVLAGTKKPPDESRLLRIANDLIKEFSNSDCWDLQQGTVTLLDALKTHSSLKIGIISNFDPRLHQILAAMNIKEYFDLIMTSHEYQMSKPDVRIFHTALAEIASDLSPSQALHIGDSYELDYVGAKKAGWNSVLVGASVEKIKSARAKMNEHDAKLFLNDDTFLNLHSLAELLNYFVREGLILSPTDELGNLPKPTHTHPTKDDSDRGS